MNEDLLMGIDVGTFSSKGVLCTKKGEILAEHQEEHGLSVPQSGWAEHDADEVWWKDVCKISNTLLKKATTTGDDIAAIAISALGPDVVPLDENGVALRPAILYGVDVRSIDEIEELNSKFGVQAIYELGGMHLTSQAIGPKILWIRNKEPHIFEKTKYLCSASTFLVYRLTGEYVLDIHSASHFNPLFDNRKLEWSDKFESYIIGNIPLPKLGWVHEVAGEVTKKAALETGLKPGTPVTIGTIDAISEAVSIGVLHPGDMMMMYGTTTFFVLVTDEYTPSETTWLTAYAFPGLYDVEAGMATSGALTRWFRDQFARQEKAEQDAGGPNAYTVLNNEAEAISPGSEGLIVLPYFSGERTPLNDPMARGVVAGLSMAHSRGHVYRAIIEAQAYGVTHIMETMQEAGAVSKRAVAVGGGTKSELLLQLVTDITGIEQELPERTIGAAYGDAFLAGLATGHVQMESLEKDWVKIAKRFTPDEKNREIYQEYYELYKGLYPKTRETMHALAKLGQKNH
jgi:xylulokinase